MQLDPLPGKYVPLGTVSANIMLWPVPSRSEMALPDGDWRPGRFGAGEGVMSASARGRDDGHAP